MNVSCPSCNTVFRVDPARVPAGGVRARCTICRAIFSVSGELMADPQLPPAASPAYRAPAAAPAPRPELPSPTSPPAAQPAAPVARPTPEPTPGAPSAAPVTPPAFASPQGTPGGWGPTVPAEPTPSPRPPGPPVAAPFAGRPVVSPSAPAAPPASPAPRPATGAPINPFLSQDPNQKARRLARALVSDLVVYHPDKRQEGLQNGTLKELFDDEIKKSWEEYTDQIGTDVADAANYFNDALNEILSDGHKIF